jgi:hypothetical protein
LHAYCAMGGRSWIDSVTNLATLDSLNDSNPMPWLHEDGAAPLDQWGPFVHEATHHWCFDSPIGLSIALLAMRSRQLILRDADSVDSRADAAVWRRHQNAGLPPSGRLMAACDKLVNPVNAAARRTTVAVTFRLPPWNAAAEMLAGMTSGAAPSPT